jgi:hypothetical protein
MEPANFSRHVSVALPSATFNWPLAMRAAVLAGLIGVILILVLRQAFALGMVTSGFLSVYFYRRKNPFSRITAGTGALLGALSGAFGTVLFSVPCILLVLVVRSGGDRRATIVAAFQQQVALSTDPHAQEFLGYLKTPEGFTLIMTVGIVAMLVFFLVLSSLGGAIAAVIASRKPQL